MLYLHGGGYVVGSLATHRGLVANIARATVGKVLAIDYRLAPEHPFPAAVDDAVSAYRWLLNNNHEPQNITFAAYLAGASPRDSLVAPIYGDLKGLPPLLIQVGTAETLLDDARRLATRAIADGVVIDYQEWPDMVHVFQHFAPMINEGYGAIERIGAFVRHHTYT